MKILFNIYIGLQFRIALLSNALYFILKAIVTFAVSPSLLINGRHVEKHRGYGGHPFNPLVDYLYCFGISKKVGDV